MEQAGGSKHMVKFDGSAEVSEQAGRTNHQLASAGIEIFNPHIQEIGVVVVFLYFISHI